MRPHATRTSSDYTSITNKFKAEFAKTPSPPPREFKPLRVEKHPRAEEMRAYADLPSRFA